MLWTPERISLLERLRAKGLSHTAVGIALGVSRGAVAGKLWRLAGNLDHRTREQKHHGRVLKPWGHRKVFNHWTENRLTERWVDRKRRTPTP